MQGASHAGDNVSLAHRVGLSPPVSPSRSDLPTGSAVTEARTTAEAHAARDDTKEAAGEKEGLLVGRGAARDDYGRLITGADDQCLADACSHGLEEAVHGGSRLRTFLPLARARRYRAEQGMTRPAEGTGAGALPEEGVLPMRTVERICQIMAKHFGEEAALCADVATLMGVLGTLGAEFTAAGEVSIARLAEQFALVPQPGDERPGLLSLLHRLNRHYIQALGEGASTVGNADEFPRSSSC